MYILKNLSSGLLLLFLVCFGASLNSQETRTRAGTATVRPNPTRSVLPAKPAAGNMAQEMLQAHNQVRARYRLPSLTWDAGIAQYAKAWAEYLKVNNGCKMKHRSAAGKKEKPYGENLYWSYNKKNKPEQVVNSWSSEAKDYNYATNRCKAGKICGHFTQVIWKNTTKVGCAMVTCGLEEVWVCNYSPHGNIVGQKPY